MQDTGIASKIMEDVDSESSSPQSHASMESELSDGFYDRKPFKPKSKEALETISKGLSDCINQHRREDRTSAKELANRRCTIAV